MSVCSPGIYGCGCHGRHVTLAMASQSRCTFAAGGDTSSSPIIDCSDADVANTSDRAFLIGVAGGTASGKVIVFVFGTHGTGTVRCITAL